MKTINAIKEIEDVQRLLDIMVTESKEKRSCQALIDIANTKLTIVLLSLRELETKINNLI